jgi:hypothetical protein
MRLLAHLWHGQIVRRAACGRCLQHRLDRAEAQGQDRLHAAPGAGAPRRRRASARAAKTLAAANWPESPEQRRIRLKAEATAAQNDPLFVPTIKNDGYGVQTAALTPAEQQARFRAARKANTAGSPTSRAFLSEPPLEYRAPAATAEAGVLGEDELKKEKRLKREAQKKSGSKSWRDLVPWL